METYLLVKWIHILSSTLLFGTGLGIAFFMWMAHLRGDAAHIAATARTVVIADACFTAPAVVVQFLSGWWLARFLGLARAAVAQDTPLPSQYRVVMGWWFALGWPAFIGVMAIFWLMVAKPAGL